MKKQVLLLVLTGSFFVTTAYAQLKLGTNPTVINAGSILEMETIDKGILMPRIALSTTTTWGLAGTPAAGMSVYNTAAGITSSNTAYPANGVGEYYWDGTGWVIKNATLSTVKGVRATVSGTETYANNTLLPCVTTFSTTVNNFPAGAFNTTGGTFTVPAGESGWYNFTFNSTYSFPIGDQYIDLRRNGLTFCIGRTTSAINQAIAMVTSGNIFLNAGDVVTVFVLQNSGGAKGFGNFACYTIVKY